MEQPLPAHELQRFLSDAREEQIARVVAMVDALAERGAADGLIAPLRPRLAQIRPPRPLRFARLLFLPLDPIIVSPVAWRLGQGQVPRTAIAPIAAAVHAALGHAPELERQIAGRLAGDSAVENTVGAQLWSPAAAVIAAMTDCPGWQAATGLAQRAWAEIRLIVSAVLRIADRLTALAGGEPAGQPMLIALLDDIAGQPATALDAIMSVMLERAAMPERLLFAVAQHSPAIAAASRTAASRTLKAMPDLLENCVATADLPSAAMMVARIAPLIDAIESTGAAERVQVQAARSEAAQVCAARFHHSMADEFMAPLARVSGAVNDAQAVALESTARELRRFEGAGRRLGNEAAYNRALREAEPFLTSSASGLERVDRLRLAEIVFGPERAASVAGL